MSVVDLVSAITEDFNATPVQDVNIDGLIKKVLAENESAVQSYKAGKQNSLEFLLGQVLRLASTKPDVAKLRQNLISLLQ
jgi:Asp-tRNA(Asn)/Glu-tRNA(Gln) amidotransferase B subunit